MSQFFTLTSSFNPCAVAPPGAALAGAADWLGRGAADAAALAAGALLADAGALLAAPATLPAGDAEGRTVAVAVGAMLAPLGFAVGVGEPHAIAGKANKPSTSRKTRHRMMSLPLHLSILVQVYAAP